RHEPAATSLPPVLPFVLHHGPRPWRSACDVRQLIDLDGGPPELAALQPSFAFALDDLGALDEPALHTRRLTIQTLLPLLPLQQLRRHAATAALLLGWRRLHLWLQAVPGGQPLLDMLLSYVAAVSTDSTRNLQDAYAHMSKSIEERYLTTADQLIREGIG